VLIVLLAIPLLAPQIVVGYLFKVLTAPGIGLLHALFGAVGLGYDMNNPVVAWASLLLMDAWHWTSLVVLLCYAGLRAIPQAYYQAARIDGAGPWAIFRHIQLPRLRLVLLIALTLPFALIGGVMAAWLGGGVLSLGSLVGFVTVLGIAARNGILLVSHYRHLEKEEGHAFSLSTVLQGSEERLIPILMTAATAALALLPLVLKGDVPGNEIERPMNMVVKSIVNKSTQKVHIIQSVDRKISLQDIANARALTMDQLIEEMEAIVYSGTRLDISYYIDDVVDEDIQDEIFNYFRNAETDSMQAAIEELADEEIGEFELRLVRLRFISENAN
jgi:hypothetical protein